MLATAGPRRRSLVRRTVARALAISLEGSVTRTRSYA